MPLVVVGSGDFAFGAVMLLGANAGGYIVRSFVFPCIFFPLFLHFGVAPRVEDTYFHALAWPLESGLTDSHTGGWLQQQ